MKLLVIILISAIISFIIYYFIIEFNNKRNIMRILNYHFIVIELTSADPDLNRIAKYLKNIQNNKRYTISSRKVRESHAILLSIIEDLIQEHKIEKGVSLIPTSLTDKIYYNLKTLHKDV